MKYYISEQKDGGLSVSTKDGTEEDRRNIFTLADNLFGTEKRQIVSVEGYGSHIFYLRDLQQFKRLIKWKCLFDNWSPHDPFSFLPAARNAVKIAREILNKNVFENVCGGNGAKEYASKYCF